MAGIQRALPHVGAGVAELPPQVLSLGLSNGRHCPFSPFPGESHPPPPLLAMEMAKAQALVSQRGADRKQLGLDTYVWAFEPHLSRDS